MSQRLYHLHDPSNYHFARAGRLGTWYPDPGPGICPECTSSRQKRVSPLVIEWLPDSNVVGDFVWPGYDDEVVVSQRVKEAIESTFGDVEFRPIEMRQNPRLKRPQKPNKRSKPRVWLPYEGPNLWELCPTTEARLDLEASGWSIKKICGTCGVTFYATPGYERRHHVVALGSWSGADIFRIREIPLKFCTERAKVFIENQGFTNVSFLEDGTILD